MSVKIRLEMQGDFNRAQRNLAERIVKAIQHEIGDQGQVRADETRTDGRPFLSDESFQYYRGEVVMTGWFVAEDAE